MTELLCRLFVKDRDNIRSPEVRRAYGTLVSIVGIIVNLVLAAGKILVGMLFGAISIAGDGINNLSDAGSQIISLISFKMAAKPADRDHPFGHARIEYVASMIVSFFVMLVGWNLFRESLDKILDDGVLTDSQGRKVDFKNTIIIMTSNIGSRQLKDFGQGVGFSTQAKQNAKHITKKHIGKIAKSKIF